jgi:hypothetical protein
MRGRTAGTSLPGGLGEVKSVWEDLNLFLPLATAARGELGKYVQINQQL